MPKLCVPNLLLLWRKVSNIGPPWFHTTWCLLLPTIRVAKEKVTKQGKMDGPRVDQDMHARANERVNWEVKENNRNLGLGGGEKIYLELIISLSSLALQSRA